MAAAPKDNFDAIVPGLHSCPTKILRRSHLRSTRKHHIKCYQSLPQALLVAFVGKDAPSPCDKPCGQTEKDTDACCLILLKRSQQVVT